MSLPRGGCGTDLPEDVLAELKATAEALAAPGKGFLASDESAGPWLRARHKIVCIRAWMLTKVH